MDSTPAQLVEILSRGLLPFNFVQIGGFDGVSNDPLHKLICKFKIPGVIAEPQIAPFERLSALYGTTATIKLVRAAVDWNVGERDLHYIKDAPADWMNQLASFRRDTVLSHKHFHHAIEKNISTCKVPCIDFAMLLERGNITDVGILQIDTEGYDYEILKMVIASGHRPTVIHFEHCHLSARDESESRETLQGLNYEIRRLKTDTLAIKRIPDR